jgi:hypothetical protein
MQDKCIKYEFETKVYFDYENDRTESDYRIYEFYPSYSQLIKALAEIVFDTYFDSDFGSLPKDKKLIFIECLKSFLKDLDSLEDIFNQYYYELKYHFKNIAYEEFKGE